MSCALWPCVRLDGQVQLRSVPLGLWRCCQKWATRPCCKLNTLLKGCHAARHSDQSAKGCCSTSCWGSEGGLLVCSSPHRIVCCSIPPDEAHRLPETQGGTCTPDCEEGFAPNHEVFTCAWAGERNHQPGRAIRPGISIQGDSQTWVYQGPFNKGLPASPGTGGLILRAMHPRAPVPSA